MRQDKIFLFTYKALQSYEIYNVIVILCGSNVNILPSSLRGSWHTSALSFPFPFPGTVVEYVAYMVICGVSGLGIPGRGHKMSSVLMVS